jgi:hypothetical protein
MQPLTFNERVYRIGQHVIRARLFFDLWYYFEGEETRSKIVDIMEEYNEFFKFTPHAYLTSHLIYIAGVFDKTKGTISFIHLIREAIKIGVVNPGDANKLDKLMADAKPLADKAAVLRHGAFAHRSASVSYNDTFKQAAVTPEELRELTDIALAIANNLLAACGLQSQYFRTLPREAAEAMMKALEARSLGPG